MTRQELGESNWFDLPNVGNESAQSRYFMNSTDYEGFINGQISVAFWNTDPAVIPNQFYYLDGITPMVEALECTGDGNSETVDVYLGDTTTVRWGTVLKCEQGPSLTQTLLDQHGDKTVSPPTIIMSSDKGEVFLIVEESSSYPSFLYSIWSVGSPDDTPTELEHKFHIAATMRLAEAVVTGIVHGEISGEISGGACFGLLRKFSQSQKPYGSVADRASPFGEHPAGDSVEIQQLEKIEVGLEIGVNALVCFICIMLLTSIGIAWSFCLRSSIGMDVYDRDELIRAVSISGATAGDTSHSEMRIFVRKEDTGDMRVVVNDTGDAQSGCARILRKGGTVVEDTDPTPTVSNVAPGSDVVGGAVVPVGSRTVVLEGIRVRPSRRLPGPNGNFHYPTSYSLTASPVPSNANSPSGTPVWCPSPSKLAPRMGRGSKNGRGASVLFDTVYSPSDSDEGETYVTHVTRGSPLQGDCTSGAFTSAITGPTAGPAVSDGDRPRDIEMPRRLNNGRGNGKSLCSPGGATTDLTEGSSPLPPLLIRRDFTLGPPQLAPLTHSGEEESKGYSPSSEIMC